MTQITFLGAAGTVTGSKYLVEAQGRRLLVDCGLFQGLKELRLRNWSPLPFDPSSLDAVLLTHAHIDHSGYLPKLHQAGFRGPVLCTKATRDLLGILLPDAGHLQEEEAAFANKRGFSKHHPALPLYTRAEAEASLGLLKVMDFHEEFEPVQGFRANFSRAGHILGSACLWLKAGDRTLAFSGDVGRPSDPLMRSPEGLPSAETLIVESTYGDRRHSPEPIPGVLEAIVRETVQKKGALIVPAFAVGRAQHLLHLLAVLRHEGRIPDIPAFLDSPMAIQATDILARYPQDHRLTPEECRRLCEFARYTRTPDESKAIDLREGPMIVISASGMATGGRILHHLKRFLPGKENTVLLVGYQAAGTRGRSLADGAKEIKIQGGWVQVRARVAKLEGLSAHADHEEMVDWLGKSGLTPKRVFVTHGEPAASEAFRQRLKTVFGWEAVAPSDGSSWDLG